MGDANVEKKMSLAGKKFPRRNRWVYEFKKDAIVVLTDKREGESYEGKYEQEGSMVSIVTNGRERRAKYDGKEL